MIFGKDRCCRSARATLLKPWRQGEARESRKTRLALFAYVRRRYVGSSALRVNVRDYL